METASDMADTKLFLGPRVRRIRSSLGLTQAAMAEELGISPSYLNLVERNRRPLTAQLVLKLVGTYDIDPSDLQPGEGDGATAALREVFADPLLSGELPGPTELLELADAAPNAASGMVKLYRAYREQRERLSDLSHSLGAGGLTESPADGRLPLDALRAKLEAVPWCFPALEEAAERTTKVVERPGTGRMAALYQTLRAEHGMSVTVLPVETMPVWKRRYDRHSNRLFVSERLPRADRAELLAQELVLLRETPALDEELDLMQIEGDEARRLGRMELARYTALAVLMPYERFLNTARKLQYDINLLATRFETGFSQIAERLVSLQDKSRGRNAGLPFFLMEVDQAGNVIRRLGAKGFPAARFGGACPKLPVYAAFAQPGALLAERVITPTGDVYLTLASTLEGLAAATGERPRRNAVLLGVEDAYAKALAEAMAGQDGGKSAPRAGVVFSAEDSPSRRISHGRLLPDPQTFPPTEIGPACRLCERPDCLARSAPPVTRPLGLDDLVQGFGAYGLV